MQKKFRGFALKKIIDAESEIINSTHGINKIIVQNTLIFNMKTDIIKIMKGANPKENTIRAAINIFK